MDTKDWAAFMGMIGAFGYMVGSLFGYIAGLFHIDYSIILIPLWIGVAYFVIKHRDTYRGFFKRMWGAGK